MNLLSNVMKVFGCAQSSDHDDRAGSVTGNLTGSTHTYTCTCTCMYQYMYRTVHNAHMSRLYAIPQRNITPFLDDSLGVQFQKTGPAMAGPAGPPATALMEHSISNPSTIRKVQINRL